VVSIEPGGTVDVVYLESQETTTTTNPFCIVRVATLASGKALRRAHQISTATSNWCTAVSNVTPNFGDYIGSTSGGNRVLATWGDGRNGIPDTFYATGLGGGKSP
jgi:hypothetical protein